MALSGANEQRASQERGRFRMGGLLEARPGRNDTIAAYLFLFPALFFMSVFFLFPMLLSFGLSLFQWRGFAPPQFIGLDNFARMVRFVDGTPWDRGFWLSWGNTFYYMLRIPFTIGAGLVLALLLRDTTMPGATLFRACFFLPATTAVAAIAVIWRWIYQPQYGLLNSALRFVGLAPQRWLGSVALVKPSIILMNIWYNAGLYMMFYIAALQAVTETYYDAADIAGANAWQKFRYITLPSISPTTFFLTVMGVIWALQTFSQVYILTEGGPGGHSASIVYYIYTSAFRDFRMGYASAITVVLFALLLTITLLQWSVRKRWVHQEE